MDACENHSSIHQTLDPLSEAFADGTRHTQCEAMTAHYETCILLIEFEEDKFGIRVSLVHCNDLLGSLVLIGSTDTGGRAP